MWDGHFNDPQGEAVWTETRTEKPAGSWNGPPPIGLGGSYIGTH